MVASRIDRLTPPQQLAIKVASVIGRAFQTATVKAVFPIEEARDSLPEVVDPLARVELTLRDRSNAEHYMFKHAVTVDVAYNLMLFEQRRALHERVADWYERSHGDQSRYTALLAHHRCKAIEGVDHPSVDLCERASAAVVRAGTLALEAGARPETAGYLETGLALLRLLPSGSPAWCDLSGWVGFAAAQLGDPATLVVIGDAFHAVRPEAYGISFVRALCQVVIRGLWVGKTSWADRLIAILDRPDCARACDDPTVRVGVLHVRSARAFMAGDLARALRLNAEAVSAAKAIGDLREACFQQVNLASALADLGLYEEAETTAREALVGARHHGLSWVIPFVKQTLGVIRAARGDSNDALALLHEAVGELVTQGNARVEGTARSYLAGLLADRGATDLAESQARAAITATETVAPPAHCLALMQLARTLLLRGRMADALVAANASIALLAALGSIDEGEVIVRITHAEVLLAAGDVAGARAAIADARDRILATANRIDDAAWRASFLAMPDNVRTIQLAEALHSQPRIDS